MNGRMTCCAALTSAAHCAAAMEPADERPDDGDGTPLAPCGLTAAMEPADERPDDRRRHPARPIRADGRNGAGR